MGFDSTEDAEKWAEVAKSLGKAPDELLDEISRRKRREERLLINLSETEEKSYEIRARSIRSTRGLIDPRTHLRAQYTRDNKMECQMCKQDMPFKKRNSEDDYFEAVEALRRDHFPKEHEAQYLALCPECAAKYKEFVKRDPAARKALHNALKNSNEPEIYMELTNLRIRIQFEDKHWRDMKTVLYYYENLHNTENSTY